MAQESPSQKEEIPSLKTPEAPREEGRLGFIKKARETAGRAWDSVKSASQEALSAVKRAGGTEQDLKEVDMANATLEESVRNSEAGLSEKLDTAEHEEAMEPIESISGAPYGPGESIAAENPDGTTSRYSPAFAQVVGSERVAIVPSADGGPPLVFESESDAAEFLRARKEGARESEVVEVPTKIESPAESPRISLDSAISNAEISPAGRAIAKDLLGLSDDLYSHGIAQALDSHLISQEDATRLLGIDRSSISFDTPETAPAASAESKPEAKPMASSEDVENWFKENEIATSAGWSGEALRSLHHLSEDVWMKDASIPSSQMDKVDTVLKEIVGIDPSEMENVITAQIAAGNLTEERAAQIRAALSPNKGVAAEEAPKSIPPTEVPSLSTAEPMEAIEAGVKSPEASYKDRAIDIYDSIIFPGAKPGEAEFSYDEMVENLAALPESDVKSFYADFKEKGMSDADIDAIRQSVIAQRPKPGYPAGYTPKTVSPEVTAPVAEAVAEPVAETVAEPVAEAVIEPKAEAAPEETSAVTAEATPEPIPAAGEVVEIAPETVAAAEPVAETVAEPVAEAVIESKAEAAPEETSAMAAEATPEPIPAAGEVAEVAPETADPRLSGMTKEQLAARESLIEAEKTGSAIDLGRAANIIFSPEENKEWDSLTSKMASGSISKDEVERYNDLAYKLGMIQGDDTGEPASPKLSETEETEEPASPAPTPSEVPSMPTLPVSPENPETAPETPEPILDKKATEKALLKSRAQYAKLSTEFARAHKDFKIKKGEEGAYEELVRFAVSQGENIDPHYFSIRLNRLTQKGSLSEEAIEQWAAMERAKADYTKSKKDNQTALLQSYRQSALKAKEFELKNSGRSDDEISSEIAAWSKSNEFKQEVNEYKAKELFNKVVIEERENLQLLKIESFPPKEKGLFGKLYSKWMSLSRTKRVIYTSLAFTAIAVGSGGVTLGTAGAYAAFRAGRSWAAMAGSQVAGKLFDQGYNKLYANPAFEGAVEKTASEYNLANLEEIEKRYEADYAEKVKRDKIRVGAKTAIMMATGMYIGMSAAKALPPDGPLSGKGGGAPDQKPSGGTSGPESPSAKPTSPTEAPSGKPSLTGEAPSAKPTSPETTSEELDTEATPEEPAISQIEAKSGDSLWKMSGKYLEQRDEFKGLNEAQKTYAIDTLVKDIQAHPDKFGISAEDAENLKVGAKIDFSKALQGEEWKSLLGKVKGLSQEQIKNIESNNKAIAQWASEHPGKPVNNEALKEIFGKTEEATGAPKGKIVATGSDTTRLDTSETDMTSEYNYDTASTENAAPTRSLDLKTASTEAADGVGEINELRANAELVKELIFRPGSQPIRIYQYYSDIPVSPIESSYIQNLAIAQSDWGTIRQMPLWQFLARTDNPEATGLNIPLDTEAAGSQILRITDPIKKLSDYISRSTDTTLGTDKMLQAGSWMKANPTMRVSEYLAAIGRFRSTE